MADIKTAIGDITQQAKQLGLLVIRGKAERIARDDADRATRAVKQEDQPDVSKRRPPYRIWLVGAFSAVNVAVGRSVRRAILDGRSSALPDLLRSHKSFAAHFLEYAALVDEVMLFDNTKSRPLDVAPPLVARKHVLEAPLEQLDPAALARFLHIANLDLNATSVYTLTGGGGLWDSSGLTLETHAAPPDPALLDLLSMRE